MHISVDTRCTISSLMHLKHLLNLLDQLSIFLLPSAGWTFAPGIKATFRDPEHTAHHYYCKLVLVLFYELILHRWSREKMLTTFFKISRSCCTRSNSRFKRATSSSRAV